MERITYTLILGLLALGLNAQDPTIIDSSDDEATSGKLNNFKLVLNIGPRFLPGSGSDVLVQYIDQSPSRDRLTQSLDLPILKVVFAYQLMAEAELNRFFIQLGVEGFQSKFRTIAPYVGIGVTPYRYKDMDVRIGARLSYGSGKYLLGDVDNNSVYFEVSGTRFYEQYLRMIYRDRFIAVIPNIGVEKGLGEHWDLLLTANIHVAVKHNTRVEFFGHNGDNKPSSGTVDVDLDEVDLSFIRRGKEINKLPLSYTGLSILAGVAYKF